MKLGFTGTRYGMTSSQRAAVSASGLLRKAEEVHHGACVGADSDVVMMIGIHSHGYRVIAHPSDINYLTDRIAIGWSDEVLDSKPPLERNRDIVNACDVLLACPKGPEEMRSGTWATVRYARKQGKRIVIVWPDGNVTEE